MHDLRVPHVVQRVYGELSLHLCEGVPVAIVVVAGVVVVQLRRLAALGGRSQGAVIPFGHDRHAVGIERRDEPENHVVEDRPGRGARVGGEPVGQQHR